jgi:hypothetical protein
MALVAAQFIGCGGGLGPEKTAERFLMEYSEGDFIAAAEYADDYTASFLTLLHEMREASLTTKEPIHLPKPAENAEIASISSPEESGDRIIVVVEPDTRAEFSWRLVKNQNNTWVVRIPGTIFTPEAPEE